MEIHFVAIQDLYTEKDSLYVQTPENSSIPPPSSKTVPRLQSRKHPLAQTNKRPLMGSYGDVPPPKRQIEDDPRLIQLLKMPVYVLDQTEPGSSEEVLNSLVMVNEAADESFQLGLVDPRLLARIAELEKSLLSFGPQELTQARYKANPLEGIGSMMFINRAAMKLVCLDAHFKFTNLDHVYLQNDKIYRFADLGGGPGGFAEYLLWRPFSFGGKSTGWGITKRGDYEYQVENFHPSLQPNPKFSVLYGEDGTGNLCSAANIRSFTNQVLQATEDVGVDIVTADGLADSPNSLSQKNEDFRQFLTAQVLNMLIILREGGTFILKLHDIHSPFTLGLIWLLYRHFDKICLAKPVTSRPANSEKYLLGHRLTRPSPEVVEHLYSVLHQLQTQPQSVVSLVDLEPVMKDEKFLTYIRNMISRLCIQQHDALEDLVKFCKDPMLPQRVPNFPVKGLASRVWCIQKERYHRKDMSEMRMHSSRPHHYNRYDQYPKDNMRGGMRKPYPRPPY